MILPVLCCVFIAFWPGISTVEASAFITIPTSDLDTYRTFTSSDSSNYKTLKLIDDTLYVGARDRVFGQAADDISTERFNPVTWASSDDSCPKVQQSNGGKKCYNLIQVIQPLNSSHLLICGTNALVPQNMLLAKTGNGYKLKKEIVISSPLCSFDPDDSISSLAIPSSDGSNTIFSSQRADFQSQISIVKTVPDIMCNEKLQEESTTIVSSFGATDIAGSPEMSKVYFVSDEKAPEPGFQGVKVPTITQVCANDIGGKRILLNEWTSLLKVRLKCLTEEESPLTFQLVTDVVKGDDDMIYGTFATRHKTYRTSAVCSFRLSDIQNAFRQSDFLEKTSESYQTVSAPKDSLRPGMCAYPGMIKDKPDASTSKEFPKEHLTFMSEHNLISDVITPAYPSLGVTPLLKGPLLSKNEDMFKKIAVQQVKDLSGNTHTEIFVGTQLGRIHKFVTVVKDEKVESVELFMMKISTTPIISMKLSKELGMLYVGTNTSVKQISTASCEAYTKTCEFCDPCRMCILSRDPSCAWDATNQKCVSIKDKDASSSELLQDVKYGLAVMQCKALSNSSSTVIEKMVEEGSTEIIGHIVTNPIITATWRNGKDPKIKQEIKSEEKLRKTSDGQLQISDFAAATDASTYECEYSIKDAIVAKADYVLRSSIAPVSSTTPVPAVPMTTSTNTGIDNTNRNKTGAIGKGGGGTYVPTSSPLPPLNDAMIQFQIPIIILAILAIVIIIIGCICYRKRVEIGKCLGLSKQDYSPKNSDEADNNATNGQTPIDQADGTQVNRTNNNNTHDRISNRDDAQTTPLLSLNTPSSQSENQFDMTDGMKCKQRIAKSYDDIDKFEFIDEVETNPHKNVTLELSSSLREEGKRKRIPPARTKSMPMSAFYVVYGGKKLMCNSLQRKGGKWLLELPDQSGMSSMAGNEVIDFYDDQDEGTQKFLPSKDDSSISPQPESASSQDNTLHYLETPDRDNMTAARKAFFHGDQRKNYVTSTPNHSSLSDSLSKCDQSNTDAPVKLTNKGHRRLREQTSGASLKSHNSTDSDSTVKGSNTTLKQEETPSARRHNNMYHKHPQSKHFPITSPTSDNVNNRQEEASIRKSQKSNRSIDSSSNGSSDGDDNLHGSNKSRNRRNKKAPDSPSKESRTSQESSSSSSSNYKSARSSMVMPL